MKSKKPRARERPSFRRIIIIVVIGSMTLPSLILGSLFMVFQGDSMHDWLEGPYGAAFMAKRAVSLDSGGALVARRGFTLPSWLGLIVMDREGIAVVSSIPEYAPGAVVQPESVIALAAKGSPGVTFVSDELEMRGAARGSYFAVFQSVGAAFSPGKTSPWMRLGAPLLLVGMAFILSVIAAAILASQISRLERAAIAIASGDLETPVRAGGTREIERLAGAMEKMRSALREDLGRRARFLAAVSHDLRTPLTSIGGYIEAIEDGFAEDPSTLGKYLSIIKERTEVLEGRIQNLIEFAKMEEGEWRGRFELVPLLPLFTSFARTAADDCALAGAPFHSELEAIGTAKARADRDLLARAFENLVSNALRHGKEGGEVHLGARQRLDAEGNGFLSIDLDDEGPGIPEADRERVFEAYWRGKTPHRSEGNGLGLSIARTILRGHGWDLVAGESPQGGARLSIIIPRSCTVHDSAL